MRKYFLFIGMTLSLCSISKLTISCTTVFANDKGSLKVVARTMDLFISDQPLIVTHPRGASYSGGTRQNTLKWQSKYGSVVVTAFHKNVVSDGVNEKGLSAHLLYLSDTEYPKAGNEPTLSNVLWAQYMLDNFATVSEAIEGTKSLNVVSTEVEGRHWPIHLAIEDPTGDSAIIEFIKGKIRIYHGSKYQVMTNEPAYSIQLENLKRYKLFGGNLSLPGDSDPLSRFVRVATYLKTLPESHSNIDSVANILSVIRTAMVPFGAEDTSGNKTEDAWPTRWVTVADLINKVYFFNATTAPNIIWIDLKTIDFSKDAKILSIDPTDIELEGNINKKLK
jgi:penicillin V acylase-like amidase (Ntn superfamily)